MLDSRWARLFVSLKLAPSCGQPGASPVILRQRNPSLSLAIKRVHICDNDSAVLIIEQLHVNGCLP